MAKRRDNAFGFQTDLIEQFREARREQGIASHALDDMIGGAVGLVAKWEVGIRKPTMFNAWCWAKALGLEFKLVRDENVSVRDRPRDIRSAGVRSIGSSSTEIRRLYASREDKRAANR